MERRDVVGQVPNSGALSSYTSAGQPCELYQSSVQHLVGTFSVPGTVLGGGNKKVKDTAPLPSTLVEETDIKTKHYKQMCTK